MRLSGNLERGSRKARVFDKDQVRDLHAKVEE
jgi:hypothetical protein